MEMIQKKPALAIWGEQDRTLHAEHFLPLFRQLFPLALVHRLPGVDHYSPEAAPDAIAQLVLHFLKKTWFFHTALAPKNSLRLRCPGS
jgi:haloalkane dehalogenase